MGVHISMCRYCQSCLPEGQCQSSAELKVGKCAVELTPPFADQQAERGKNLMEVTCEFKTAKHDLLTLSREVLVFLSTFNRAMVIYLDWSGALPRTRSKGFE